MDEVLRNRLRVAAMERADDFTLERFREGILSVIDKIETRDRKEGQLVSLCRWIQETKEKYGF